MISCFSFLFKGVPRENILKEGEGGFLFVKLSESWKRRERKQLSRLLCFIFSGEKKAVESAAVLSSRAKRKKGEKKVGRTFSNIFSVLPSKSRPCLLGVLLFGSFVSKSPTNIVATFVMYYKNRNLGFDDRSYSPFRMQFA